MIDLSPDNDPADLIDALYEARRSGHQDLADQIVLLLDHEEPMVREEAIALLLTKWRMTRFADCGRQMLLHDSDEGVRARAALGVASTATPESLRADAVVLANVFRDPASAPTLRQACFEALSLMTGRPRVVELDDTSVRDVELLVAQISAHHR